MTTPNLDALAKLGPFHLAMPCSPGLLEAVPDAKALDYSSVESVSGEVVIDCVDEEWGEPVMAALNEWAELRAYKQRTEAERSEMLRLLAYCRPLVQSYEECNETYCVDGHDHEVHKRIDDLLTAAERDPALKVRVLTPKEASDGK